MVAAQQKPQERLIPVHIDEGGIAFSYQRGFALSLDGLDGPPAAPPPASTEEREQAVEPAIPARVDDDFGEFISLDDGAQTPPQVRGTGGHALA